MADPIQLEGFTVDGDSFENFREFAMAVDVFSTDYCGYWAFGHGLSLPKEDDRYFGDTVYLLYDMADEAVPKDAEEAERCYRAKEPLPKHWYALDLPAVKKIVEAGVKRYGVNFLDEYDAGMFDCAAQLALLGDLTYN